MGWMHESCQDVFGDKQTCWTTSFTVVVVLSTITYVLGAISFLIRHIFCGYPKEIRKLLDILRKDAILSIFYPVVAVSHILLWPLVWSLLWARWSISSAPNICGIPLRRADRYTHVPPPEAAEDLDTQDDGYGRTENRQYQMLRHGTTPIRPPSNAFTNEDVEMNAAAAPGKPSSTTPGPPPYEA